MLTRMDGSAFDLADVVAVVRRQHATAKQKGDRVTVYLRNATAVNLSGEDAGAFLRLVESLHNGEGALGPVGSRVAVVPPAGPVGRKPPRRKERG